MSDLISRSELLKRFLVNNDGHRMQEIDCDNLEVTVSIKDVKTIIKEQPTAYDIEKVIDELESELKKGNIAIDFGEFRLFEIVKQSGVSGDVCEWKQTSTARYKTSCGYRLEEFFDTNACYCKQCGKKIKVVE